MHDFSLSPLRSTNKEKPKISFKISPQVLKQRPITSNRNQAQNKEKFILKTQQQNFLKIPEKQNSFILKPNETHGKRFIFQSSQFKNGSINKSYGQKDKIGFEKFKCQKCSARQQSYLIIGDNMKFCSNCALEAMKNGKQIVSLTVNKYVQPVTRQSMSKRPVTVASPHQIAQQDCLLIQRIEQNCNSLLQVIQKQLDKSRVIQDYNKKRQQLRDHYQKLKQTIQIAIQKDLQNLKRHEQIQLNQIEVRKQQSMNNLDELLRIKQKIDLKKKSINKGNNSSRNKNFVINCDISRVDLKQCVQRIQRIIDSQPSYRQRQNQFNIKQSLYEADIFMLTSRQSSKILSWEDFESSFQNSQFTFN